MRALAAARGGGTPPTLPGLPTTAGLARQGGTPPWAAAERGLAFGASRQAPVRRLPCGSRLRELHQVWGPDRRDSRFRWFCRADWGTRSRVCTKASPARTRPGKVSLSPVLGRLLPIERSARQNQHQRNLFRRGPHVRATPGAVELALSVEARYVLRQWPYPAFILIDMNGKKPRQGGRAAARNDAGAATAAPATLGGRGGGPRLFPRVGGGAAAAIA